MRRVAMAVVAVALPLFASAVASAEPVVPQPGTPCEPHFANTMTWPQEAQVPLECLRNRWEPVTTPQPPNDRWLSFGPTITLHGEGMRNPNVAPGTWTATPQATDTQCRAEQRAVVSAGEVGPPQVAESPEGQPLSFRLLPQLFSIEMSGYCLWTRAGS